MERFLSDRSEDALMSITDLRLELRHRGVVDVPRSTIRNWYLFGVSTPEGRVWLRTAKIGSKRMSSVAWVRQFLLDQHTSS